MSSKPSASPLALAIAGLACLLPPLLFVSASVLEDELGVPFLNDALGGAVDVIGSPLVIVGGLVGAVVLSLYPVLSLRLSREGSEVRGSLALRLAPSNLAVAVLAGLLLAFVAAFVAMENLGHIRG